VIHPRIPIAALVFSAAGFAGVVLQEHYTDTAVVPVKGDRPTVGLGSTFRDDGSPVRMGDTITPVQAIQRSVRHIQKDEAGLKRCVTAPLSQAEYDILVDFAYQYGAPTACSSSMVLFANAGLYAQACEAYAKYRMAGGYDCSTLVNGKPNRRCWGVWTRSLERRAKCLAAQG
jgi:GH24 family phage-related lysozyme (muramidase)